MDDSSWSEFPAASKKSCSMYYREHGVVGVVGEGGGGESERAREREAVRFRGREVLRAERV